MSRVVGIYRASAAGEPLQPLDEAELEAGRGLVGDRYYLQTGTFSQKLTGKPDREITLIEAEAIEAFNREFAFSFSHGDFRRNVVTEGVALNDLEGREFSVGAVRLKGIRLCEPCAYLAGLLTDQLLPAMVHKSGLRAQILQGGRIFPGDSIVV